MCLLFVTFVDIINFIAIFITTVIWWSRIRPWFLHGYKTGKIVYISLEISWISSLFVFAFPLFLYLFSLLNKYLLHYCNVLS